MLFEGNATIVEGSHLHTDVVDENGHSTLTQVIDAVYAHLEVLIKLNLTTVCLAFIDRLWQTVSHLVDIALLVWFVDLSLNNVFEA